MPLRHEPDVSQAAWFTSRAEPWTRMCSIGPGGFEAYTRLFHASLSPEDAAEPHALEDLEGHLDTAVLQPLLAVLAEHTTTPGDCFFGLWDGFGEIHGSPAVAVAASRPERRERQAAERAVPPAFAPDVLAGPRVRIPNRDYLLFRGALSQAGQWGAADLSPGRPRRLNSPNLMWPADRAWFVATEIDQPWTGVGGSRLLVRDLLAARSLDAEEVEHSGTLPYWRATGPSLGQ